MPLLSVLRSRFSCCGYGTQAKCIFDANFWTSLDATKCLTSVRIPEESNLKLVTLVAACSYNDTAFDTSNRSADRTEAKREGLRRVFRGNRKSRYPFIGADVVDQHVKRIDSFLENGARGLPSLVRR